MSGKEKTLAVYVDVTNMTKRHRDQLLTAMMDLAASRMTTFEVLDKGVDDVVADIADRESR